MAFAKGITTQEGYVCEYWDLSQRAHVQPLTEKCTTHSCGSMKCHLKLIVCKLFFFKEYLHKR